MPLQGFWWHREWIPGVIWCWECCCNLFPPLTSSPSEGLTTLPPATPPLLEREFTTATMRRNASARFLVVQGVDSWIAIFLSTSKGMPLKGFWWHNLLVEQRVMLPPIFMYFPLKLLNGCDYCSCLKYFCGLCLTLTIKYYWMMGCQEDIL
jgi:hypothetical protein